MLKKLHDKLHGEQNYFCRKEFSLAKYVSDNSIISWGSLVNTYTPLPLGALVVFVQSGFT